MPKPRLLNRGLQDRLTTWIRAGNSITVACQACQISTATFRDWMARGERAAEAGEDVEPGEVVFAEFREAVRRADDETEAALIGLISRAAKKGSWQAAAWVLERRNPERWGRPSERSNGPRAIDEAPVPALDPFTALDAATDELAARRRGTSGV